MWEQCDSSLGSKNPTKTGYHLRPVTMAIFKKVTIPSVYNNVDKREPLYNVCRNVNLYICYGKHYEDSFKH